MPVRAAGVAWALVLLAALAPVLAPAAAQTHPDGGPMVTDALALARTPREAGTANEIAAAEYVASTLRGIGLGPAVGDVPLANGRTSRNVAASFGDGLVEVLLGAHLDTVPSSPGADDNGSGVAVLLQLARRLRAGTVSVPAGTAVTLVWFGAEERLAGHGPDVHHAGSRQYAAARAFFGALPHWMLSVDMVGFGATALAVSYSATTAEAAHLLDVCGGDAGGPAAVVARGDISDHEAFARRGTPAALLWRPDNPGYHGPGDTQVVEAHLVASLRTAEGFVRCATRPAGGPRALVHHLQADLLARRPDLAGAAHFAGRVARGEQSAGQVGAELLRSPEWSAVVAPVARVYLAAFGRHADHGGLVHWTGLRRGGASLEAVAAAFTATPEFGARNGAPDDRGFVRLLYRNVLGREADPAGETHWVAQLAARRLTRAGVLVAFSESPEHQARTASALPVALAYAGLLRRPVDAAGLAHWSGRPLADLVGGVIGSPEFAHRFRG